MVVRRTGLVAGLCLAALLAPAAAQAPAPRDVPEGFVLPGPPPTNAPAGTAGPGQTTPPPAPVPLSTGQGEAPPPAAAAAPPTVSGAMVVAPSALAPTTVGTSRLSGAGSVGGRQHRWPCVQRKTDHVEAAQVWAGPPLDKAAAVPRTPDMRRLVAEVSARRLPLPDAERAVADFVKGLPEAERESTAAAVFADLLRQLDAERSEIIRGIERYGTRQQDLAEKLRAQNSNLSAIRSSGDAAKAAEAQETLLWDTRIFEERRRSLTYVCEVPVLIEQRLFALGRAINGAL